MQNNIALLVHGLVSSNFEVIYFGRDMPLILIRVSTSHNGGSIPARGSDLGHAWVKYKIFAFEMSLVRVIYGAWGQRKPD